jgi:hypothetical protein
MKIGNVDTAILQDFGFLGNWAFVTSRKTYNEAHQEQNYEHDNSFAHKGEMSLQLRQRRENQTCVLTLAEMKGTAQFNST